jgi:bacillithiol biosynthesis cysteine-adding enzyme BshC
MISTISFQKTGYFTKTVADYLSQNESIKTYYNNFPDIEGFKKQIRTKISRQKEQRIDRKTLVKVLQTQYKNIDKSEKTKENIMSLLQENTFTITTGHQLNLFTGPLYFLYKIISTINLTEQLKSTFPKQNFVPIYWMATEDHDFDEINYFNFKSHKIQWEKDSFTAVGKLNTKGLETVYQELKSLVGPGKNAEYLLKLFKESYLEHNNLTDATRFLTNELFKDYGLVILDADDKNLKQVFSPFVKDDLLHQTAFTEVSKTISTFEKHYKVQVNPREINLFYLTENLRKRIVFENNLYKINDSNIVFSESEILSELEQHPERFSPNVIMRPLYQEVILPNLCYIGGGGELAYWLELKAYFDKVNVPFPILLLRNSAVLHSEKQFKKLDKLQISTEDLFLKQHDLTNKKVKENSNLNLDFTKQKTFLKQQFSNLKKIAEQTEKSFIGAVNAQEKKQLNGLNMLEKRLLKAEKRKLNDLTTRVKAIQDQLFPNQSLQERYTNFSELYLEFGTQLIPSLKKHLKPLGSEFVVLGIF